MNKVLVLDIETTPITAYVWGLKDQFIALNQIVQDWSVMAWGAKWLGEKEVFYRDVRNNKDFYQDKTILKELWGLLNEADIVITQNGQSFDGPKLNSRFILNGMTPPKPYKHLDTYRIVKRVMEFTSNKLEYLTAKLCVKYKKLKHHNFPGMALWTECLKGNKKAWEEMKVYNVHDVLSTEELYTKLQAWAPVTMPKPFHVESKEVHTQCRVCGEGTKMWHKGYETKATGRYHRYQCQKCFAWTVGGKAK